MGKADSPSDGLRPSSAQCPIFVEEIARGRKRTVGISPRSLWTDRLQCGAVVGGPTDAATSSFSRLRRVQRLPAEPLRKHSFIIYSGTEHRVREGFSMA